MLEQYHFEMEASQDAALRYVGDDDDGHVDAEGGATEAVCQDDDDDENIQMKDVDNDFIMTRFNCIQAWFLRCSWLQKEKFLFSLMEKLKDDEHLLVIAKSLDTQTDKLIIYSESLPTTNFIYDKRLRDDNRRLENNHLAATIASDVEWYSNLDEPDQIRLIFDLLRMSGGSLLRSTFRRALALYRTRRRIAEERRAENLRLNREMRQKESVFAKTSESHQKLTHMYDPKDPLSVEVEKRTKIWNDAINKYRIQVEGRPEKPATGDKKKDKKGKKESTKTSKKSAKTAKSGKKGKGGKKDKESLMLDQVQILPVWIVKKIFGYLDQKTLQKVKVVNNYWDYVVSDMADEKAARKYIDKIIKKMESSLELVEDEGGVKQGPLYRVSTVDKRMEKLADRGACTPKLRKITEGNTYKMSLIEETTQKHTQEYLLPVNKYETFPRNNPINDALYLAPACVFNETGEMVEMKPVGGTVTIVENVSYTKLQAQSFPELTVTSSYNEPSTYDD